MSNKRPLSARRILRQSIKCLLLCAAILVASCASHRRAARSEADTPIATDNSERALARLVESLNANRHSVPAMTGKISLALESGGKNASIGGKLRMKRDDVIQLSLVALGLLEVGRMELTQDYFLLFDRMHNVFVKSSYADIPLFAQNGIDFFTFQSLFWDELFVTGSRGKMPEKRHFRQSLEDGSVRLVNDESRQVLLTFIADAADALVRRTSFADKRQTDRPLIDWQYLSYAKLAGKPFPNKMQISLQAGGRPVTAVLSLKDISDDAKWETRTNVNLKKYTQVSLDEVMKRIMSLTQ